MRRVIALTYVREFFHKLGFQTIPTGTVPEKAWAVCVKRQKHDNGEVACSW